MWVMYGVYCDGGGCVWGMCGVYCDRAGWCPSILIWIQGFPMINQIRRELLRIPLCQRPIETKDDITIQ